MVEGYNEGNGRAAATVGYSSTLPLKQTRALGVVLILSEITSVFMVWSV